MKIKKKKIKKIIYVNIKKIYILIFFNININNFFF